MSVNVPSIFLRQSTRILFSHRNLKSWHSLLSVSQTESQPSLPKMPSDKTADGRKPQLVVFDMDYTLWPFHVDTNPYPPLRKDKDGKIRDRSDSVFEPFPGVTEMIQTLFEKGQKMALVSRTDAPTVGKRMLELLDWNKYFPFQEIYPGKKTTHFAKIQRETKIPLTEMLFFDDEHRNIRDISAIGVTCFFLKEPMSQEVLDQGFAKFANGDSDR